MTAQHHPVHQTRTTQLAGTTVTRQLSLFLALSSFPFPPSTAFWEVNQKNSPACVLFEYPRLQNTTKISRGRPTERQEWSAIVGGRRRKARNLWPPSFCARVFLGILGCSWLFLGVLRRIRGASWTTPKIGRSRNTK